MLQLFRRHLILTVCTVVAIVLVFIGWSVRPDVAPSPGLTAPPPETVEEPGPAPISAMPDEAEPVVAMESTEACEIPPDWLQVEGRWDREISEERIDRILEFAEAAFIESKNIDELVFATTLNDQSGLGIERFVEEISSGARSPYLVASEPFELVLADAHMPDPANKLWRKARTPKKADEIGRHHDRHRSGREAFDPAANTQERALHPVSQHQQCNAKEQGPGAGKYLEHGAHSYAVLVSM